MTRPGGPPAPAAGADRGASVEREADVPEDVELARADSPDEERSAAPLTVLAAPAPASNEPTSLADHPWAGSFAGLTGRLVEADGTPVEGLEVELYEFDAETVFSDGHHPVREELCTGKARSGADGRFSIEGMYPCEYVLEVEGLELEGRARVSIPPRGALVSVGVLSARAPEGQR